MKRIICFAMLFCVALNITAFASVNEIYVKDTTLKINGTSDKNGRVTAKLEKNGEISYYTQTICQDGNFLFDIFDLSLDEGQYELFVTAEDFSFKQSIAYPEYAYKSEEADSEEIGQIENLDGIMIANRVKVTGKATPEKTVTLVLYKGVPQNELDENMIGYIEQGQAKADGGFEFEFAFCGNMEEYRAIAFCEEASGEKKILKTDMVYSYISTETTASLANNEITLNATIKNDSLNDAQYIFILIFYDENDNMLEVSASDKKTVLKSEKIKSDFFNAACPQKATRVFATVWSSFSDIIPLSEGVKMEIRREQ